MHIKFNKDFRVFKKDDEIDIPIKPFTINWIVGDNRSGKSTVLKLLRKHNDSLREELNHLRDGLYTQDHDIESTDDIAQLDGIDHYDLMFFLDAINDDPTSINNAGSAGAFVGYGGYEASKMSKGQKAASMLGQFINLFKKALPQEEIDKWFERANKAETLDQIEKCSVGLMCFDEIDEGMDLSAQMMFLRILHNITTSYGVDIIVVTHSLMLPILDCSDKVFDMKTRSEVSVCDYMQRLTGKNITIKVEDEKEVH